MLLLLTLGFVAVVAAGSPVVLTDGGPPKAPSSEEKQLWRAMGDFGTGLVARLHAEDADDNVLLSPLSVHSALAMALEGARGETRQQMIQAMQLSGLATDDKAPMHSAFADLTARKHENTSTPTPVDGENPGLYLPGGRDFTMKMANRMYLKKVFPIDPSYTGEVQKTYHADAVGVDFEKEAAQVTQEINGFVNNQTNGLIPQILQQPLDKDTVLALINTLYFKGDWKNKMGELNETRHFNKGCGGKIEKADHELWLTLRKTVRYLDSDKLAAQMVRLPYLSKGYTADMVIILPKETHVCKTKDWFNGIQWEDIRQEMHKMNSAPLTTVDLTMPRFEMDSRFELQDILPQLGMPLAFQRGAADFSGMTTDPNERLNIDQVIHQTKMIVTRHGTEAAAATVVSITRLAAFPSQPVEPVPMNVNRSFYVALIYGIHEAPEEALPLFSGIVNKV